MELANSQHEAFAQHVAAGLSLTESAKRAGYAESAAANCGSRVAKMRAVANRIEELRNANGKAVVMASGIRAPQTRVAALEDRWNRMRTIITARSEDPDLKDIPGGKTGLLVKQIKVVGTGQNAQLVETYVLDTSILQELRAHEQQAAEELGQWITRASQSGNVNAKAMPDVKFLGPTQLNVYLREELKSLDPAAVSRLTQMAPELSKLLDAPASKRDTEDGPEACQG